MSEVIEPQTTEAALLALYAWNEINLIGEISCFYKVGLLAHLVTKSYMVHYPIE